MVDIKILIYGGEIIVQNIVGRVGNLDCFLVEIKIVLEQFFGNEVV